MGGRNKGKNRQLFRTAEVRLCPPHEIYRKYSSKNDLVNGRSRSGRAGNRFLAADWPLFLSVSAVEKHVSAIFTKLGLVEEPSSHRRVAAVLAYLADR